MSATGNPKLRNFVGAFDDGDEMVFVEQVGHARTSLFGLPVTVDPAL